jgi:DNA-binding transcriptional ArsR family regulator
MAQVWNEVFQIASREPHLRILRAASPGVWFDHASAARANSSSKQSVSRPLSELESHNLLVRRRKGRGDEYLLTRDGEAVRGVFLSGPPLLTGSWIVAVDLADGAAPDVRSVLTSSPGVRVLRCAGDFDFLAECRGEESAEDVVDDLVRRLRELGTQASRAYVVRQLATPLA